MTIAVDSVDMMTIKYGFLLIHLLTPVHLELTRSLVIHVVQNDSVILHVKLVLLIFFGQIQRPAGNKNYHTVPCLSVHVKFHASVA